MRTTNYAARAGALAALLLLAALSIGSTGVAGEKLIIEQQVSWAAPEAAPGILPSRARLDIQVQGWAPPGGYPMDIIIIVDASASSHLAESKSFAFNFIDRLGSDDRVGLVSYGGPRAVLGAPLVASRLAVKTAVADLTDSGKSGLGDAIRIARRELASNGRDDAVWAVLLLSDGYSNIGEDPEFEAKMAAEYGVQIVSVGIGHWTVYRNRLQTFADDTNGAFFARPTETTVQEIQAHLQVNAVATSIVLEKRLPVGIQVVAATPAASRIEASPDGGTVVQWRISSLRIGQRLSLSIDLRADSLGPWTESQDLVATYKDFRGVQVSHVAPPANWPPVARFSFSPSEPTTTETIQFTDLSHDADPTGEVVHWEWRFGQESVSHEQHPEFRFSRRGTYTVRLTVTDAQGASSVAYERQIVVGNAAPIASFVLRDATTSAEATRPHLGVTTVLDAGASVDPDGHIVLYRWDVTGDGTVDLETPEPKAEYAFDAPGARTVTLTVVDDEGKTARASQRVDILPSVMARRIINTCMPDDVTVPAGVVEVRLIVGVNTVLNGLSITETLPEGWAFNAVDNDGATIRHRGQTVEWLFLERFMDDGVNVQREIRYTLTAPSSVGDRTSSASLQGVVGSSSPRVSLPISGEDRMTVSSALSVPVAISRWDTRGERLNPCLAELVSFDQVQYAVSLWLSEGEVPYTGGRTVDLRMMQDLIAYWLTGSSVHDPLP